MLIKTERFKVSYTAKNTIEIVLKSLHSYIHPYILWKIDIGTYEMRKISKWKGKGTRLWMFLSFYITHEDNVGAHNKQISCITERREGGGKGWKPFCNIIGLCVCVCVFLHIYLLCVRVYMHVWVSSFETSRLVIFLS